MLSKLYNNLTKYSHNLEDVATNLREYGLPKPVNEVLDCLDDLNNLRWDVRERMELRIPANTIDLTLLDDTDALYARWWGLKARVQNCLRLSQVYKRDWSRVMGTNTDPNLAGFGISKFRHSIERVKNINILTPKYVIRDEESPPVQSVYIIDHDNFDF